MKRTALGAALATTLLILAGCGDDGDKSADDTSTPTETATSSATETTATSSEPPAPTGPPACADIWVVGETLPTDFAGCEEDGAVVSDAGLECTDGTTLYVYENPKTGDDQFFGITGQKIGKADGEGDDAAPYAKAYDSCAG